MAKQFTSVEWRLIRSRLEADPERYGLPQREYGSVLWGRSTVRKLGDDAGNPAYIFNEPRVGYRMPKGGRGYKRGAYMRDIHIVIERLFLDRVAGPL